MASRLVLAFLSLSGVAVSQSTSITSLFLFANEGKFVASVVGAAPSATTFQIDCPSGTPSDECGLYEPITVTASPSGIEATMTYDEYAVTETCTVKASDSAVCHATMNLPSASGPTVTDVTFTGSSVSEGWVPVTITAGLEKLGSAAAAAATTGASTTGGAAASTGASTGASPTATGAANTSAGTTLATKTPTGSATGPSASPASTGAAANNLVHGVSIAGVAGAVAMVMAL